MAHTRKSQLIYPGDKHTFDYWVAITGVRPADMSAAILETGSVDPDILVKHLAKGKPFFYLGMLLKSTWLNLKSRFDAKPQYL